MNEEKLTSGRGGFRQGAGRPKGTKKVNSKRMFSFRLSQEEEKAIRELLTRMRKGGKMNRFYFDDKTEQIVTIKPNNGYTVIDTEKDLDTFINDYEAAREEGNSIIDSIEWAK